MNKLTGKVASVTGGAPYASLEITLSTGDSIAAIAPWIEGSSGYKPGEAVEVFFDELDVFLAKSFTEDSTIKKKFKGTIKRVDTGESLSLVVLDYKGNAVAALVRTSSWNSLGLGVGSEVLWLIKATKVTVGAK